MEWLLLALAGAGGLFGASRFRARQADRAQRRQDLDVVSKMADEDVTVFGEQLRHLDADLAGRELDETARRDYQIALDAYEKAGFAVRRLRDPDEVSGVTDTLASGRYAIACVRARLDGLEVPELRVPCFFNPQHGPSVTDVSWTRPGRGTRRVPACAQDAARVAAHEQPELRMVKVASRPVPYWEAGAALAPYFNGYFVTGHAVSGAIALGWAFAPHVSGHEGGGWDSGVGGGFDTGGGLGGGFEGGGGGGGEGG